MLRTPTTPAGRVDDLRATFTKAEKFGAVDAVSRLERFMRQARLRVTDLFALVDHDASGTVDRAELRAALSALRLDLSDDGFEALFRYLDAGGNGTIEATELEEAIRQHRRFLWLQGTVTQHEADKKEAARRGLKTPPLARADDPRRSAAHGRLVTTRPPYKSSASGSEGRSPIFSAGFADTGTYALATDGFYTVPDGDVGDDASGGGGGGGPFPEDPAVVLAALAAERNKSRSTGGQSGPEFRATSLPLLGQSLVAAQLPPHERNRVVSLAGSGASGPAPRTVWDLQAESATRATQAAMSRQAATAHEKRNARRLAIRAALKRRRDQRAELERTVANMPGI